MTPPQQVTIDISKERKGKKGKGKKEDKLIGSQLVCEKLLHKMLRYMD
jgi:hypothetical protein